MRLPVPSSRRARARALTVGLIGVVTLAMPGAAVADHQVPGFVPPAAPLATGLNSGGEGAEWELIGSIPTGNPQTDLDYFTRDGETFVVVGTLGAGLNAGGQSIFQLTQGGEVAEPEFVSSQPSASCVVNEASALGLQHDVEVTPKSPDVINNSAQLPPEAADAQLIIDATDAGGRCHDQGNFGVTGVPPGGLEIIDITDLENPVEIGLTSNIGQAHTVNIDPRRPNIAYAVSSDSVSVTTDDNGTPDNTSDDTFTRNNETSGNALDGFEVVDLASCLAPPYGTMVLDPALEGQALLDAKRDACEPETYRYRYPTVDMALGHTNEGTVYGCHELEIYPDDRLACGAGGALIMLDMSGAFITDPVTGLPKPKGTPLPCLRRESTSATNGTGAMIMDCTKQDEAGTQPLTVSGYPAGNQSLQGVEWTGTAYHQGRGAGEYNVEEDIDFNHEAEITRSGKNVIGADERGGGVTPPGAACDPADANLEGNGGVHAYAIDKLKTVRPKAATDAEEANQSFQSYATGTDGEKAIFRAPIRTGPQASLCTAHVMQQIPGQNRIFMGWYSQGTQVIDYVELPGGKFEWVEDQPAQQAGPGTTAQAATTQAGYFIQEGANTWVSAVFKVDENDDGTFTYYGTSSEFGSRNGIDVYKATLPAPATACTLAPDTTVTDRDQAAEVHRDAVDCVIHYGISKGKTATTYAPLENVTREQMASFVVNEIKAAGAGDKLQPGGADEFNDISTSFHRDAINQLKRAGIIQGVGGGAFNPKAQISRQQMATFMVNAARFVSGQPYNAASLTNFGDVPANSIHARNINAGFEAGLFQGRVAPDGATQGTFAPLLDVRRDSMATFLRNLFLQTIQP